MPVSCRSSLASAEISVGRAGECLNFRPGVLKRNDLVFRNPPKLSCASVYKLVLPYKYASRQHVDGLSAQPVETFVGRHTPSALFAFKACR